MAELLFEIFCEEIPARMQSKAGVDLAKALTDGLKKAGLSVDNALTLTGPRRLAFSAEIPLRSPDVSEERKGPRTSAPEQALAGFMRGAGITDISQAEIRSDKKGEYYVAIIQQDGRDSADILAELIPAIMSNFSWPKSMKSGSSNFRWVRPLTSMICVLGGTTVEFDVGGITSGNTTEGHRRMGRGPFTVTGLADYRSQLEGAGKVVLSADDRKATILDGARKACAAKGLELVEDEGLLNEVAGLVEYPFVILGDMDQDFLKLPGEVIRLSMRTHQKYFAVRDPKTGNLAPHFIVVANQVAADGGTAIAAGNSRVLSARLADALFFEEQDVKQKLEDYYDKLDTVVFHQKLGSIKDKTERVAALARELAPKVGADPDAAEQAARLAKCDLVTNMVVEFTSLQGQIGRLMYEKEGGDADIAIAIEEHYKPQGPSDSVPTNPVAVAVALADKLDTLVGFWAIDEKPTGSKDPYALRRAALGVVRIVLENEVVGSTKELLSAAHFELITQAFKTRSVNFWNEGESTNPQEVLKPHIELNEYQTSAAEVRFAEISIFPKTADEVVYLKKNSEVSSSLLAFIADRLKVHLRDQNIRHDLIDAVFALGEDDLVAIVNRTTALQTFLSTEDGTNLVAGYKRAANILRAEHKKQALPDMSVPIATDKLSHQSEQNLIGMLELVRPKISKALEQEAYGEAMTALSSLRIPIDAFFNDVMVNDEDQSIRANRLRLLGMIRDTASAIADFDKIDG